jgi:hybrid cluster-associated redox disulfide protein
MPPAAFTPQTLVADVLAHSPQVIPLFFQNRLACVGCPMESFCTLEDVCEQYGLDLDLFLQSLEQMEVPHERN